MRLKESGFAQCTNCNTWSDIPDGFKEIFHFVKCLECGQPMYLCRGGITPSDIGLRESQKRTAGLMKHGEKL